MLRILWRDFTRRADTFETVRDTSLLAEASLRVAQDHLMAELVQRFLDGCAGGARLPAANWRALSCNWRETGGMPRAAV